MSWADYFCLKSFASSQTKKVSLRSHSWNLTICGFLFNQSSSDGFFWNIFERQPLVPWWNQRRRVCKPVAFGRGASACVTVVGAITVISTIAVIVTVVAGVHVVTPIRVASLPSRRVRIQQVWVRGCPSGSGGWGCWDLDLTRTFHCLGKMQKTPIRKKPKIGSHLAQIN